MRVVWASFMEDVWSTGKAHVSFGFHCRDQIFVVDIVGLLESIERPSYFCEFVSVVCGYHGRVGDASDELYASC